LSAVNTTPMTLAGDCTHCSRDCGEAPGEDARSDAGSSTGTRSVFLRLKHMKLGGGEGLLGPYARKAGRALEEEAADAHVVLEERDRRDRETEEEKEEEEEVEEASLAWSLCAPLVRR